jgi:hypothetical protein
VCLFCVIFVEPASVRSFLLTLKARRIDRDYGFSKRKVKIFVRLVVETLLMVTCNKARSKDLTTSRRTNVPRFETTAAGWRASIGNHAEEV